MLSRPRGPALCFTAKCNWSLFPSSSLALFYHSRGFCCARTMVKYKLRILRFSFSISRLLLHNSRCYHMLARGQWHLYFSNLFNRDQCTIQFSVSRSLGESWAWLSSIRWNSAPHTISHVLHALTSYPCGTRMIFSRYRVELRLDYIRDEITPHVSHQDILLNVLGIYRIYKMNI